MKKGRKKHAFRVLIKAVMPAFLLYAAAIVFTYGPELSWFFLHTWMSPVFHFLGGIAVAWGLYNVYDYFCKPLKMQIRPRWLFGIAFVSVVALVGVLWECYEMYLTVVFGFDHQPNVPDTIADLLMDILGGMFVYMYIWLVVRPKWLK